MAEFALASSAASLDNDRGSQPSSTLDRREDASRFTQRWRPDGGIGLDYWIASARDMGIQSSMALVLQASEVKSWGMHAWPEKRMHALLLSGPPSPGGDKTQPLTVPVRLSKLGALVARFDGRRSSRRDDTVHRRFGCIAPATARGFLVIELSKRYCRIEMVTVGRLLWGHVSATRVCHRLRWSAVSSECASCGSCRVDDGKHG